MVSICIPVYNGEKYIRETINSVLNQTYKDIELIISDNKSTDNTIDIVKSYSDSRIHIFENDKNYGMFGNWNLCLERANGEYIRIMCADDCLAKDCIEKQIEIFEKDKTVGMVFSNSCVINKNGKKLFERKYSGRSQIFDGAKIARESFRKRNFFGEPSNVLIRSSFAKSIDGFSAEVPYSSDWDYWLRLAPLGKVGFVGETLSFFRVSSESGTSAIIRKGDLLKKDDQLFVRRAKENHLLEINDFDVIVHCINNRFRLFAKMLFMILNKSKG